MTDSETGEPTQPSKGPDDLDSRFPAYAADRETTLDEVWSKALIIPDANVLLDSIRDKELLDGLKRAIEQVRDRLWIPHQFALAYQRTRQNVIFRLLKISEASW